MQKAFKNGSSALLEGNAWTKLTAPKVGRGKTAFPSSSRQQQQVGMRWDYDGEVTKDGTVYHKYQVQPNAGKIPPTIQQWRESNGGTHAVMTTIFVKKDGTKEDVEQALEEGRESMKR